MAPIDIASIFKGIENVLYLLLGLKLISKDVKPLLGIVILWWGRVTPNFVKSAIYVPISKLRTISDLLKFHIFHFLMWWESKEHIPKSTIVSWLLSKENKC